MNSIKVNVRYSSGTYTARGKGKSASCTMSADAAVRVLAGKLGLDPGFGFSQQHVSASHSVWELYDSAAEGARKQALADTELRDLAQRIADGAVRSDIECYAAFLGGQRYDLSRASERGTSEEEAHDVQRAQDAARYIDLRGDVFPWRLVHDAKTPNLVQFKVKR